MSRSSISQSQRDAIRRLLQADTMSKLEIARRFGCSAQTVYRIAKDVTPSAPPPAYTRTPREIAAKRELDSAFAAFERCPSSQNHRRLADARYEYEIKCHQVEPSERGLVNA